ncbi:MAG TPA: 16S rRNA (guanine(527)-N(7))-methyltransferase RsmG [Nitrospiraceae bacterium]
MEHEQELRELTINSIRELGLAIEENHVEQFMRYLAHLIEWNRGINITSVVDPRDIIVKHFVDSLASLVSINFPKNCTVLDIGSGGGFPGIPLRIIRPDIRLILVEPVQKKCSFLNSVIGLLRLQSVFVFNGTIEQYAKNQLHYLIDMVVIRALKYEGILKHIPALLAPNGKIVLYRTKAIKGHDFGKEFHVMSETALTLPQETGNRVITVIEKTGS